MYFQIYASKKESNVLYSFVYSKLETTPIDNSDMVTASEKSQLWLCVATWVDLRQNAEQRGGREDSENILIHFTSRKLWNKQN